MFDSEYLGSCVYRRNEKDIWNHGDSSPLRKRIDVLLIVQAGSLGMQAQNISIIDNSNTLRKNPCGVGALRAAAADTQPPLRKFCSRTRSHRGSSGNNFGFLRVGLWVSASTYQAFGLGQPCRQWSRSFKRRNIKVLAWSSCCRQWSGSFKLRNIKALLPVVAWRLYTSK